MKKWLPRKLLFLFKACFMWRSSLKPTNAIPLIFLGTRMDLGFSGLKNCLTCFFLWLYDKPLILTVKNFSAPWLFVVGRTATVSSPDADFFFNICIYSKSEIGIFAIFGFSSSCLLSSSFSSSLLSLPLSSLSSFVSVDNKISLFQTLFSSPCLVFVSKNSWKRGSSLCWK